MEPLDHFSFEEEWQRALNDASEQPPAAVWDKIEQVLDEKSERKGIFWLWLNNNRLRIAAGIALLFSFGFLFYQTEILSKNDIEIASTLPKNNTQKTNNTIAEIDSSIKLSGNSIEQNLAAIESNKNSILYNNSKSENLKNNLLKSADRKYIELENLNLKKEILITSNNVILRPKQDDLVIASNENLSQNPSLANENRLKIEAAKLASKSKVALPPNRLIRRLILDYEVTEIAEVKSKKEFWLGLQSGGGSFNPNFSNSSINVLAAKSFDSPYLPQIGGELNTSLSPTDLPSLEYTSIPNNQTKSSEGFRSGLSFGMKISKNWSIESGLSYLRGNSYLESNTYSIDKISGVKSTYFAEYISNNSANYADAKVQNRAITTVADEASFLNQYEFLSIPMQAGYTFLAKRKLNFSILGGVSADVFVGNLIGGNTNLNVSSFAISQNDKIYKPLNISGLGTVRVNYILQKNWSVYLGGQYQQGFGSLLIANPDVNINIKQKGIQTGLNYKF